MYISRPYMGLGRPPGSDAARSGSHLHNRRQLVVAYVGIIVFGYVTGLVPIMVSVRRISTL